MSFAFSTASGGPGNVGFECALTSGDQRNTTALFKACQSPLQYANLADGQYQFYVRAQGEEIADSRAFTKVRTGSRNALSTGQCLPMLCRPFTCIFAAENILPLCKAKQMILRVPQFDLMQVQVCPLLCKATSLTSNCFDAGHHTSAGDLQRYAAGQQLIAGGLPELAGAGHLSCDLPVQACWQQPS